jgi:hypothetical protein
MTQLERRHGPTVIRESRIWMHREQSRTTVILPWQSLAHPVLEAGADGTDAPYHGIQTHWRIVEEAP